MAHPPPPLKPHWFHILTALAAGDRHGSAIVRDVLSQTDGDLHLWPATLYGSLEALAEAGLIRELSPAEVPDDVSARRRYWRLTGPGREALGAEASRLAGFAAAARERLRQA